MRGLRKPSETKILGDNNMEDRHGDIGEKSFKVLIFLRRIKKMMSFKLCRVKLRI